MGTQLQPGPDPHTESAPLDRPARGLRRDAVSPSLSPERRWLGAMLEQAGVTDLAIELWDGQRVPAAAAAPAARVILHDRAALWRLLLFPEYWFPELYSRGRMEIAGDLERCLEVVQNGRIGMDPGSLRRRLAHTLFLPSDGSQRQARENIHHHYDLGNDFYRLWLDRRMLYTCAYYRRPDLSLEQAQEAKMDHICRKLRLRPGERVVEAGCGWGSLALHMARHYGVSVRAYNISRSQLALARETARQEGLERQVEFVEADYRDIQGEYDAFVSVGMLEHVGRGHYGELGRAMDRCLTAEGRGLIHTIGTDRPGPLNSWIERHIFPGAYPPALTEMLPLVGDNGFSVLDVENLRLHYARTLSEWRARFEDVAEEVQQRYGERFVRTWRFYLASSQASFQTGHLQLFQVLFARKGFNGIPWSRDYLYHDATH